MPWLPPVPALRRHSRQRFWGLPRRVFGGYLLAEGAAYAHHAYAKSRARHAPKPERGSSADPEYSEQFLSLARCDARKDSGAGPLACARFVRHAFYGVPPEALSRDAVASWLRGHVGETAGTDEALAALEAALGPYAPSEVAVIDDDADAPAFVYGEGPLRAWYKPLPLRMVIEGQRLVALCQLAAAGFVEHKDPRLPPLRYYTWGTGPSAPPMGDHERLAPLVVLHGYGRGIASPLFSKLIPDLGRRPMIIVECPWLLVTRVPGDGDVTRVPAVREIAAAVAAFLREHLATSDSGAALVEVDVLGHSFGTAVASALARELHEGGGTGSAGRCGARVAIRRAVLMDPMCFLPGMTKQAQLLQRSPRDLASELVEEVFPGAPVPSYREVIDSVVHQPEPRWAPDDEAAAAVERRRWVIFQTYFFFYFIFRDLVYSWVNSRCLQGPEYLDRGNLRNLNRQGRLLTVLAETDTMIPAPLLRDDLSAEVPAESPGGVMWLPTVGHGACQHRSDVVERIAGFLAA